MNHLYNVISRFVLTSIGIDGDPFNEAAEAEAEADDDEAGAAGAAPDVVLCLNWEFASVSEKWHERSRSSERRKFWRSSLEWNVVASTFSGSSHKTIRYLLQWSKALDFLRAEGTKSFQSYCILIIKRKVDIMEQLVSISSEFLSLRFALSDTATAPPKSIIRNQEQTTRQFKTDSQSNRPCRPASAQWRRQNLTVFLESECVQHLGNVDERFLRQIDAEWFVPDWCPPERTKSVNWKLCLTLTCFGLLFSIFVLFLSPSFWRRKI